MENTPKGNQGSAEEIRIAEGSMTEAEKKSSELRAKSKLRMDNLAKENNISDEVIREIYNTVEKRFPDSDSNWAVRINGLFMTIGHDGRDWEVSVNGTFLKSTTAKAIYKKYIDVLDAAYYAREGASHADAKVRDERQRYLEDEQKKQEQAKIAAKLRDEQDRIEEIIKDLL